MSAFRRSMIVASLVLAPVSLPLSATAASTTTYTYDAYGQLVGVSSTAGRTVSYSYDPAGNRTNMTATGTAARNQAPPVQLTSKPPGGVAQALQDEGAIRSAPASDVKASR